MIVVKCECGRELSVNDEAAGKRVKCPACGRINRIGTPQTKAVLEPLSHLGTPPSTDKTDERMRDLERDAAALRRRCRRMELAWTATLLFAGVTGLALWVNSSAKPSGQNVGAPLRVEAEQFVLRDRLGNPRAVLQIEDDGQPKLTFTGHYNSTVSLGFAGKESDFHSLIFRNSKHDNLLLLATNISEGKQEAYIGLHDKDGSPAATLRGRYLSFQHWPSRAFAQMGFLSDGKAFLDFADKEGSVFWALPERGQ